MNDIRPPKDCDLTTLLYSEEGHIPPKALVSTLVDVRQNYKPGELIARLQKNGLFLVRALMLAAEHANDTTSSTFARKYAAICMYSSAWHSFAEEKPTQQHGVTRRRLKHLDLTRRDPETLPTTATLHQDATLKITDCIIQSNQVITAVRAGMPEAIEQANTRMGRMLGNTALHIAAAPVGDRLRAHPWLGATERQIIVRDYGQKLKNDALELSEQLGVVPSLALLAEPHGSPLRTLVQRTMPQPLADGFASMEAALFAA
jgi:hypothetical protein